MSVSDGEKKRGRRVGERHPLSLRSPKLTSWRAASRRYALCKRVHRDSGPSERKDGCAVSAKCIFQQTGESSIQGSGCHATYFERIRRPRSR